MKYFILTYGCQMNKADSEKLAADLERKGYTPASNMKQADLMLINMCSVRQSAVDRIYGLLPKLKGLKAKTVLTGCILKEDKKKFRKSFNYIWPIKNRSNIQPKHRSNWQAFVPVSNGCNNFCSYCVVPFTRGKLVCRPHQQILKEIKSLIEKGFREIWLLGQNVNDYACPTNKKINFARLLKKVNNLPGNFQIRFMSPHPKNLTDELIETMAQSEKVAKYLNLPVQSGDNQILKRMNRNYTVRQYKNLVKRIRKNIPQINLSTDVIVGFPGETKKQFENTVKLFQEMKFNIAYISKYSPRPGTAASHLKDTVPLKEKKRREKCLRKFIK